MRIDEIEPFLEYYEKIRRRTRRVIDCIPPQRFDWTCREGGFTLADLIRHLAAIERWMFAENAAGRPNRYPGHGKDLADGPQAVLAYFEEMHRQSMQIFSRLTPQDLCRKCLPPSGLPITTWKWLRAMVEHEVHHRGQIYLYLALAGVRTPPLYGMTSEQVRDAAAG